MRIILMILAFTFCQLVKTIGQEDISPSPFERKHSFHLELGGPAVIYSINFESIILNYKKTKTFLNVGFSLLFPPEFKTFIVPVTASQVFSLNSKHHLEFGFGITFRYEPVFGYNNTYDDWHFTLYTTGRIGYRFQSNEKRWIYRFAFIPLWEGPPFFKYGFHPLASGSIGYSL